ncbi:MAG: hypothetical protein M1828_000673 [Chrysothrix sp. TS-e1954]|nr:MAG: hypothetical protein M1828_000673 [Chrysothrix sp. TS-e1954]
MSLSSVAQLPARPPTPPISQSIATGVHEALDFLGTTTGSPPRTSLVTPPTSSPISQDERPAKRLRFDSSLSYCGDGQTSLVQDLGSSRHAKSWRSTKSILKTVVPKEVKTNRGADVLDLANVKSNTKSLSTRNMLEDCIQQLRDADITARFEAYGTLIKVLKSFENSPNSQSSYDNNANHGSTLRSRLPLLEEYLRRDIAVSGRKPEIDKLNLSRQALKTATAFFWDLDSGGPVISSDFATWLANHALSVAESPQKPKGLLKRHLNIFTFHPFCKRVLNTHRASRLLTILEGAGDVSSSDDFIIRRLVIYQRLTETCPDLMLTKIRTWFPAVFGGLISRIPSHQRRALTVGTKAAHTFGATSQAGKAIREFLEQQPREAKTNFGELEARLYSMLKTGEEGAIVPQIWSLFVLFQRSKKNNLLHWHHWAAWQGVIQKCFNCSSSDVNVNAFHAWDHLIYSIASSSGAISSNHSLRQPVIGQLCRSQKSKSTIRTKQAAFSTYRMLLYYSLRSSTSPANRDLAWKHFVHEVLAKLARNSLQDRKVCEMISTILFNSTLQDCSIDRFTRDFEDRAGNCNLPRMDSSWIRRNTALILQSVEPYLFTDWSSLARDVSRAPQLEMWKALLNAILEAGSKEIKTAVDLERAIAEITSTLWRLQNASENDRSTTYLHHQVWLLCHACVTILGPRIFVDNFLLFNGCEAYSIAKDQTGVPGPLKSPLSVILRAEYWTTHLNSSPAEMVHDISDLLGRCLDTIPSARRQLELVCSFATCMFGSSSHDISKAPEDLWVDLARRTVAILSKATPDSDCDEIDVQSLAPRYEDAVAVLCSGLNVPGIQARNTAEMLFNRLFTSVSSTSGHCRAYQSVLGRLLACMSRAAARPSGPSLTLTTAALNKLSLIPPIATQGLPEDHIQLRQAWVLAINVLEASLLRTRVIDEDEFSGLLGALSSFVAPASRLSPGVLDCSHSILAHFFRAESQFPRNSVITARVSDFWSQYVQLLFDTCGADDDSRDGLEDILCAGFQSQSVAIAIETIRKWNSLPDERVSSLCSRKLSAVLRMLKERTNVRLLLPRGAYGVDAALESLDSEQMFPWMAASDELAQAAVNEEMSLTRIATRDGLPFTLVDVSRRQTAGSREEAVTEDSKRFEGMPPSSPSTEGKSPLSESPTPDRVDTPPVGEDNIQILGEFPSSPPVYEQTVSQRAEHSMAPDSRDEYFVDAASEHQDPATTLLNMEELHDEPDAASTISEENAADPAERGPTTQVSSRQNETVAQAAEQVPVSDQMAEAHTSQDSSPSGHGRGISRHMLRARVPTVVIPLASQSQVKRKARGVQSSRDTRGGETSKRKRADEPDADSNVAQQPRKTCRRMTPQRREKFLQRQAAASQSSQGSGPQSADDLSPQDCIVVVSSAEAAHPDEQANNTASLKTSQVVPSTAPRERSTPSTNVPGKEADADDDEPDHGQALNSLRGKKRRRTTTSPSTSRKRRSCLRSFQGSLAEEVKEPEGPSEAGGLESTSQELEVDEALDTSSPVRWSSSPVHETPRQTTSAEQHEADENCEQASISSSIISQPSALARTVADCMRRAIRHVSTISLGKREQEGQRRELEDLGFGYLRALNDAGRRVQES